MKIPLRFLILVTATQFQNLVNSLSSPISNQKLQKQQLLINKSKELQASFESYSKSEWSNRYGAVITPVSIPGVYSSDRAFYWNKMDVGGRMTIIELADKRLWIHSPVKLDSALKEALEELGTVEHVISPNYEHVKYAQEWNEAFPSAKMWACPGLSERVTQVNWFSEIPFGIRPNSEGTANAGLWNVCDEIQCFHINCELNPFTKKPFFNEVIFYHVPSKSALFTDAFWNYPADTDPNVRFAISTAASTEDDYGTWELAPQVEKIPFGSKFWKFGMDQVYYPFYFNFMIQKDTTAYKELRNVLLEEWDIETIIPCHGDIIRGKELVQDILCRHFQF